MLFFYEESIEESRMHVALRCEAGELTNRTIYYDFENNSLIGGSDESTTIKYASNYSNANIEAESSIPFKKIHGQITVSMLNKGLISDKASSDISGEWYAADGVKIRRLR